MTPEEVKQVELAVSEALRIWPKDTDAAITSRLAFATGYIDADFPEIAALLRPLYNGQ